MVRFKVMLLLLLLILFVEIGMVKNHTYRLNTVAIVQEV